MLVLGYLYAHWLQGLRNQRWQALVHIGLLAASLLALPIVANPSWKPSPTDDPAWRILALLLIDVGLPYFMVSTTSSLLQAWYARTHQNVIPYRLFALSNLASLVALISYPLAVETILRARTQGQVWSAAYAAFAVLCGVTAWLGARPRHLPEAEPAPAPQIAKKDGKQAPKKNVKPAAKKDAHRTGARERLLWFALAFCASTLLLAVTNYLTRDVAAVPFLWIAPLAAYLLSFVVCFDAPRWYNRWIWLPLTAAALWAILE